MIEMNRISRLAHKTIFLTRQRHAVTYGHKYVINDKDINKKVIEADTKRDTEAISKVLIGFDPDINPIDRRILYEVTRMRLHEDEFHDQSSSNSDDD